MQDSIVVWGSIKIAIYRSFDFFYDVMQCGSKYVLHLFQIKDQNRFGKNQHLTASYTFRQNTIILSGKKDDFARMGFLYWTDFL